MNILGVFFYLFLNINFLHSVYSLNKLCPNSFKNKSLLINMKLTDYKDKNNLPLFSKFKPDSVVSNTKELITQLENDFNNLQEKMKNEDKKYYNVSVNEREKIEYPLGFYWGVVSHLTSVKNSDELRKAHEEIMPEVIKVSNSISQSKILYECLEKSLQENLNPIQKRIIEKELKGMQLNGVNLEEEKKKKFLDISLELGELSNKFRNNVLDSIKNYKMIIKDDENMQKMPLSSLELFSQKAKDKDMKDSTPKKGPWVVTLDGPSLIAFMTYYPDSNKRKELYKASITKASKNEELITKILKLHQKLSELLKYKNYVEVSLSKKMATRNKIDKLLNDISEKSKKKGKEDYEEIDKFANKKLELWDIAYYSEKLKEETLKFKEEDLKPYLVFDNVLSGLFKLSEKIFNIQIKEVDTKKEKVELWHPDVKYFKVFDVSDTKNEIASFYLDPYVRPGEKKGGAWMDECIGKSKVMNHKPVAYLILNGTPPLNGKPSLMTLGEMETLFHEFGHGLQHMLTKVEENSAAGISNIEWDAVELPSQFMENWCYHKKTLLGFAKHYQTGETLPDDLYNKIIKQNKFHVANGINRQIYFSMLDLYVYENEITSVYDAQKKISEKYLVKSIDEDDRFLCAFEHIFAGGYSAGYYSYKWAEIMSLDAFSAFEEIDMDDDEAVKKLGLKFRNTILSKGGGTDPLTVFKEFRGREPNSDAFMKHYGLI